ncbi:TMS membrane protein/tumor differentially expressed protein [Atractiella rhizophila]|nr:TMS membrane protein/tumor differentially expressed protein [Atractiella rhizophila]
MGAFLSLPLLGTAGGLLTTLFSSCIAGLTFFCTSKAATAFCKSCNCNSSVATRVGFSLIMLLNSVVAWIMLTPWAVRQIEKWSYDYIKMNCEGGTCYGVLAVHRFCFALAVFHLILSASLVDVHDTRTKRAEIQNGWWGPKIAAWIVLVVISFFIPNGFFIFWGNYVAPVGATVFILIGLVLLVDFAHSWSEKCLENWQETDSTFWKTVLIGSTLLAYAFSLTLTILDYIYFASGSCHLNQFFVTFNFLLSIVLSVLCVLPVVQEANYKSGLSQSGMVLAYCTYLVTSALANRNDPVCNPLSKRADGARQSLVLLGAIFTFLAIAYSTSRAATQSKALAGKNKGGYERDGGYTKLPTGPSADDAEGGTTHGGELGVVNKQPTKRDALVAAVAAGSLPASALEEHDEDDDKDEGLGGGDERDDERTGTRYNYAWFHIIFAMAAMYIAMLLTDWNVVSKTQTPDDGGWIKIGRSTVAMWIRIVSSWFCLLIYGWTLIAPVIWPERFDYDSWE